MITCKQLKAIAAFASKDGKRSYLRIDFDHETIGAADGPSAVLVKQVEGLNGKGLKFVPIEVVYAAITLLGNDGIVSATDEDFCGIPYVSTPGDLIDQFEGVFEHESLALPGRPGLYASGNIKRLENLCKEFKGTSGFVLPTEPDKPLLLKIDNLKQKEEDRDLPTEIIRAAIMPYKFETLNRFWGDIKSIRDVGLE